MSLKKLLLLVIFTASKAFSIFEIASMQALQQQDTQNYSTAHPVRVQLNRPSITDVESQVSGEIANDFAWKEIVEAWEMITSSSPFASFSTNNFFHLPSNSQPKTFSPCNPEFEAAFWNEMTARPSFPNPSVNEECFFLGLDEKTGFIMPFVGQTPLIALLKHPFAIKSSEYMDRMNGLITKSSLSYLNHVDLEGYSALMYAAEKNFIEPSYSLLLKGVNVTQRSTTGETALSLAMFNSDQRDHVIRNMLMYYILRGTLGDMLYMSSEFFSSYSFLTRGDWISFAANETYSSYF